MLVYNDVHSTIPRDGKQTNFNRTTVWIISRHSKLWPRRIGYTTGRAAEQSSGRRGREWPNRPSRESQHTPCRRNPFRFTLYKSSRFRLRTVSVLSRRFSKFLKNKKGHTSTTFAYTTVHRPNARRHATRDVFTLCARQVYFRRDTLATRNIIAFLFVPHMARKKHECLSNDRTAECTNIDMQTMVCHTVFNHVFQHYGIFFSPL